MLWRPATLKVMGIASMFAFASFVLLGQETQVGSIFTDSSVILWVSDVRKVRRFMRPSLNSSKHDVSCTTLN